MHGAIMPPAPPHAMAHAPWFHVARVFHFNLFSYSFVQLPASQSRDTEMTQNSPSKSNVIVQF